MVKEKLHKCGPADQLGSSNIRSDRLQQHKHHLCARTATQECSSANEAEAGDRAVWHFGEVQPVSRDLVKSFAWLQFVARCSLRLGTKRSN